MNTLNINVKTATKNPSERYGGKIIPKGIISDIQRLFPECENGMLIPAMTHGQIENLPYIALYNLAMKASYLSASGFASDLSYSEEYLNLIINAYRVRYNKVSANGYKVYEDGILVAYYGYKGQGFTLIEVENKKSF